MLRGELIKQIHVLRGLEGHSVSLLFYDVAAVGVVAFGFKCDVRDCLTKLYAMPQCTIDHLTWKIGL